MNGAHRNHPLKYIILSAFFPKFLLCVGCLLAFNTHYLNVNILKDFRSDPNDVLRFKWKTMSVLSTMLWRTSVWKICRTTKIIDRLIDEIWRNCSGELQRIVSLPENKSTGNMKGNASQTYNMSLVNAHISTFIDF